MDSTNNNNQRDRRVTDKHGGLLDAANQAVRLERIEGDMRLLAQRVSSGMESVTSTLAQVQVELRGCSLNVAELRSLQGAHDANKVAIDKVEKSVTDLGSRLEGWFSEFEQKQDDRWREHEAENEDLKRSLEKEIRGVRETTIRFAGFGAAVVLLGGTVVGGFVYNINYRFNEGKEDITEAQKISNYNRTLIDGAHKELVDIKLYLARGGRIPAEPYVPQSQRNDDDGHERPRPRQPAD